MLNDNRFNTMQTEMAFLTKKRNKNQAMVEAQNYNSTFKLRVVESDIDFGVLSSLDLCSVQRYMSLWKNHNIFFLLIWP